MVTKSLGIYNGENEHLKSDDEKLIVEFANAHIALTVQNIEKKFSGFELFTFNENAIDVIFNAISNTSYFLNHSFYKVEVVINHEDCLPVPLEKFEESYSADFLNLIYGPNYTANIYNDYLQNNIPIVNCYRVSQAVIDVLTSKFDNFTVSHNWSKILKRLFPIEIASGNSVLHVQFYHTFFIAVVFTNGTLQIIQHFIYENPEDVLYQLLNLARQFELDVNDVQVRISGIIDPAYKLFRELSNYFKQIVFDKIDSSSTVLKLNDYPTHYFRPFI